MKTPLLFFNRHNGLVCHRPLLFCVKSLICGDATRDFYVFCVRMLEKTLESPLDCKKIQPVHPKGDQSWVFIVRTDAEAKTPVLWPPGVESWLIWKDPDAGKDWGQEEKGTTEDEMVGWHCWHNGHGFGWTPGVGDGQGGLVCCGSWGRKELDTTEWMNWTELCETLKPFHEFLVKWHIAAQRLHFFLTDEWGQGQGP